MTERNRIAFSQLIGKRAGAGRGGSSLANRFANNTTSTDRHRGGVALVWTAIFLLLMMALMGLGIDAGRLYLIAHQLQNAADAASLAAVPQAVAFGETQAREKAVEVAYDNHADTLPVEIRYNWENNEAGDVVIGRYNRSLHWFDPGRKPYNAVKVVAPRADGSLGVDLDGDGIVDPSSLGGPIELIFGPIARVNTVNVSRYAIAMVSGGFGAGLITLDPQAKWALRVHSGNVVVKDTTGQSTGMIQVNSNDDAAFRISGSSSNVTADGINVVGDIRGDSIDPYTDLSAGWIDTNADALPDPLAWLPAPADGPLITSNTINVSDGVNMVLEPGYYPGGIRQTGGNLILKPGIYVVDDIDGGDAAGLYQNGGNLIARGVMFYVKGQGVVYVGGNGFTRISELLTDPPANYFTSNEANFTYPSDFQPWEMYYTDASKTEAIQYTTYDHQPYVGIPDGTGFAYPSWLDAETLSTYWGMTIFQARDNFNDATLDGTSDLFVDGTLYFPRNHLNYTGNDAGLGTQLICWTLDVGGAGDVLINYDGRNQFKPSMPFLVE